jgi:hypothetical protein
VLVVRAPGQPAADAGLDAALVTDPADVTDVAHQAAFNEDLGTGDQAVVTPLDASRAAVPPSSATHLAAEAGHDVAMANHRQGRPVPPGADV